MRQFEVEGTSGAPQESLSVRHPFALDNLRSGGCLPHEWCRGITGRTSARARTLFVKLRTGSDPSARRSAHSAACSILAACRPPPKSIEQIAPFSVLLARAAVKGARRSHTAQLMCGRRCASRVESLLEDTQHFLLSGTAMSASETMGSRSVHRHSL